MGDDLGVLLLLLGKAWLPEVLSSCQCPFGLPPLPQSSPPSPTLKCTPSPWPPLGHLCPGLWRRTSSANVFLLTHLGRDLTHFMGSSLTEAGTARLSVKMFTGHGLTSHFLAISLSSRSLPSSSRPPTCRFLFRTGGLKAQLSSLSRFLLDESEPASGSGWSGEIWNPNSL